MIDSLVVKPEKLEIESGMVALWDQNPAHAEVNPAIWAAFGGAFIVGDKHNPDKTYLVAATPGVYLALQHKRLVKVEAPIIAVPVVEVPAAVVEVPAPTPPAVPVIQAVEAPAPVEPPFTAPADPPAAEVPATDPDQTLPLSDKSSKKGK